jgi:flagellar biosynthesis/type III secretory pathway protein FliH
MAFDNAVTDIRHREGFEKGFEKGFTEGFAKGFKKHSKLVVKNLLKQGSLKPEAIATSVGVSVDLVEKLAGEQKKVAL